MFPVPFRPYLKLCKANRIKENSSGEKDPSEVNKVIVELAQGELRKQDNGEPNPIEYYKKLMNNKLLHKIVYDSNKYAIQSNPSSPLNLNRNELEQLCGTSLPKNCRDRLYKIRPAVDHLKKSF